MTKNSNSSGFFCRRVLRSDDTFILLNLYMINHLGLAKPLRENIVMNHTFQGISFTPIRLTREHTSERCQGILRSGSVKSNYHIILQLDVSSLLTVAPVYTINNIIILYYKLESEECHGHGREENSERTGHRANQKLYSLRTNLCPGDRLPTEQEFSELFGVSRTSIREATKALSFFGDLFLRRPGRV